jgi:hypothetical protein
MSIKVRRWPSEMNVLTDAVMIVGDTEVEVQAEAERIGEDSGEGHFLNPTYNRGLKQWILMGEVTRPAHD